MAGVPGARAAHRRPAPPTSFAQLHGEGEADMNGDQTGRRMLKWQIAAHALTIC
jgi:hypothetical protein